jgi:YVTN family beta-propeller protein
MKLQRITVVAAAIVAGTCACGTSTGQAPAAPAATHSQPGAAPSASTVYVVSRTAGTVTPVDTATNKAGQAIKVGAQPSAIAITPDRRTAYVVNQNNQDGIKDGTVTPITTATDQPGKPIWVGTEPDAIAITPNGQTAYVANQLSNTVTPITIATNTPGTPIKVGYEPDAIAITPDGKTAYVVSQNLSQGGTVTPIDTATDKPGKPINVGASPRVIAITPDGQTAYVASSAGQLISRDGSVVNQGASVTQVNTTTNQPGNPITINGFPIAIAITPDGRTAYVLADSLSKGSVPMPQGDGFVVPVATATGQPGRPIRVGILPSGLAITPDGKTLYVADSNSNAVTPIDIATSTPGHPISTGSVGPVAILISPDGQIVYTVGIVGRAFSGTVTPITTTTSTPGSPVDVGAWPSAIAIVPNGHTSPGEITAAETVLPIFASVEPEAVPTTTGPPVVCPVEGTPPTPEPCFTSVTCPADPASGHPCPASGG